MTDPLRVVRGFSIGHQAGLAVQFGLSAVCLVHDFCWKHGLNGGGTSAV